MRVTRVKTFFVGGSRRNWVVVKVEADAEATLRAQAQSLGEASQYRF